MFHFIQKIKYYFWAWTRPKINLVIDTCVILSREDRRRLRYLRSIYIPRAVMEQVLRMGLQKEKEEGTPPGTKNIFFVIEILILEKILQKKWHVAGSTKTGLLQSIENKTLAEFDRNTAEQLLNIFKKSRRDWNLKREKINLAPISDPHKIVLRDMIGVTDLRIIAACMSLKQEDNRPMVLVTRDRSLTIFAEAMGIRVIKNVNDI